MLTVLAALSAVAPLAIDMYVPAFPRMAGDLDATSSGVQLSMTTFLLGLVIGQFLVGPISDGHGRRRLLLAGSALFALFSLACALAPGAQFLAAARLLEGMASAVGMVIGRAVITDRFEGPTAAGHFAVLSMITAVAPVVAPVLGGLLLALAQWRAIFAALAGFGLLLLLGVWWWVPESLPADRRHPGGVGAAFLAMGRLLTIRAFLGYALTLLFSSAVLFAYISGSSFVFQDVYGVSTTGYSLIFAINAIPLLVMSAAFKVLARHVRLNALLCAGIAIAVLATAAQFVVALAGGGVVGVCVCLFVTMIGLGLINPATTTIGMALARHAPGGASALFGSGMFLLGALVSPLLGVLGTASATPMAAVMLIGALCALVALLLLGRPWHGRGEPVV